jgi:hypothetical protein
MKIQPWMIPLFLGFSLSAAHAATESKVIEQIDRAADMAESTYGVHCSPDGTDYRGGRSLVSTTIYKYACKNAKGRVSLRLQAEVRMVPGMTLGQASSYQLVKMDYDHSDYRQ